MDGPRQVEETENTWKVELQTVQGSIIANSKERGTQAFPRRRGSQSSAVSTSFLLSPVSNQVSGDQETHRSKVTRRSKRPGSPPTHPGPWCSCCHDGDLANTHSSREQSLPGPLDSRMPGL